MKKNFLKVAALLIAAMLMVVSCTQEVAPVDNGLVEARISVGYGRDLKVEGDTKTSNLVYKYTMAHKWTEGSVSELVHGDKNTKTVFEDNVAIGYVTPGLWEINVFAYEAGKSSDSDVPIFEGSAQAYFSNQKNSVKVYLEPTSNQVNTLNFEINMQDLSDNANSYKLYYSVYGTGTSTVNSAAGTSLNKVELREKTQTDTNSDGKNDTTQYKGSTTLTSGFYRVTVSVYSVGSEGEKLVGGITKGFLLSGGAEAKVSGHIEPSDYEKVTIDAVYIDVNTTVIANSPSYEAKVEGENATPAKATVTFRVNDSTGTTGNASEANKSYIWYVAENDTTKPTSSNTDSFTVVFEAPGYKTVTCQTIYTVTFGSDEYKFADTKSCQVYIDANNAVWK